MGKMGRPTLFEKDGPDIHGRISKVAAKVFEVERKNLERFYKMDTGEKWPAKVSDGDVIEFLLRGGPVHVKFAKRG